MIEIIPLRTCHSGRIARLHMENLQSPFQGRAGRELLTLYYATLAQRTGGCGYVAISEDEILGYVCGIWDPRYLRIILFRANWSRLVFWGLIHIVSKPLFVVDLLNRFHPDKNPNRISEEMGQRSSYELRPIVVSHKMRGSGLGDQLVERLINDARERGYRLIYLYTEEDNGIAKRFYVKSGFTEIGKRLMNGKYYLHFELGLS